MNQEFQQASPEYVAYLIRREKRDWIARLVGLVFGIGLVVFLLIRG